MNKDMDKQMNKKITVDLKRHMKLNTQVQYYVTVSPHLVTPEHRITAEF